MGFESFFEAKKKKPTLQQLKKRTEKQQNISIYLQTQRFNLKGFFFFLILTFLHVLWLALPHTGVAQSTGSPRAR